MDRDKTYERAVKFMNNVAKKRNGVSNVYVFTSVDKEGNVVDDLTSWCYHIKLPCKCNLMRF